MVRVTPRTLLISFCKCIYVPALGVVFSDAKM
jgi:hypothetical protein